jgi:glycosyltransferase involved in cell wall biosynthesis
LPNTTEEKNLISNGFSISPNKFSIIPNGVSERFLSADPDLFYKKYGLKDFILNVGHIGPKRKNVLALVKALEKINHQTVIIGKILNTGETEEVKQIIQKNKNILLIEELGNNSPLLASAYAACNTFVLPSLFETPGIAALEAALCGAKIVITPFGGTKDYFKDMAEYVNPKSIESIQKGIEKSLNLPKADVLQNFIKENFLWSKIAQLSEAIYESVKNSRA